MGTNPIINISINNGVIQNPSVHCYFITKSHMVRSLLHLDGAYNAHSWLPSDYIWWTNNKLVAAVLLTSELVNANRIKINENSEIFDRINVNGVIEAVKMSPFYKYNAYETGYDWGAVFFRSPLDNVKLWSKYVTPGLNYWTTVAFDHMIEMIYWKQTGKTKELRVSRAIPKLNTYVEFFTSLACLVTWATGNRILINIDADSEFTTINEE
jgi:hypothetical protein